jgi:protein TonB
MSSLKRFSTPLFWSLGIHAALFWVVGASLINTHAAPSRTMSIELRDITAQKPIIAPSHSQTTIAKNVIADKTPPFHPPKKPSAVTPVHTHNTATENTIAINQPDTVSDFALNNSSTTSNTTTDTAPALTTTNSISSDIEKPIFDAAFLKNPQPSYPVFAKKRQQEGTVMLKVKVSTEGKAEVVELAKSSGFSLLDDAAQQAVAKWQFIPARHGDLVVIASVIVPIRFALR